MKNIETKISETDSIIVKDLWDGLWGSDNYKKLSNIGDELSKVRNYANERIVDDAFSKGIVYLCISSYFACLVPIVRIESAIFLADKFKNECVFALAARSYIELVGRLHKGRKIWDDYYHKEISLEKYLENMQRLLARHRRRNDKEGGIYLGEGYSIGTFINCLKNDIPDVGEFYGELSRYIHGDYETQKYVGKLTWLYNMRNEHSPWCIFRMNPTTVPA